MRRIYVKEDKKARHKRYLSFEESQKAKGDSIPRKKMKDIERKQMKLARIVSTLWETEGVFTGDKKEKRHSVREEQNILQDSHRQQALVEYYLDSERFKWEHRYSSGLFTLSMECMLIQLEGTLPLTVLVTPSHVILKRDHAFHLSSVYRYKTGDYLSRRYYLQIPLAQVKMLLLRNRLHRPTGLEIYLQNKSYLIDCLTKRARIQIVHALGTLGVHAIDRSSHAKEVQQKWLSGDMSNYEYLMWLNILSGRSYNDVSQYPIFPWVQQFLPSDPPSYRELRKPVGALAPSRLTEYKEKQAIMSESEPSPLLGAFLYGCHYSYPGVLTYYLVRMEPYASLCV